MNMSPAGSDKANPFGPIVGNMEHVFPCRHKNFQGNLYIATKAVCFRRTTMLHQWKVSSVIIPWNCVSEIDESTQKVLVTKIGDDLMHEFDSFDVDLQVVKNALSSIWKGCKDKFQNESNDEAVDQFYRRICFFPESDLSFPDVRNDKVMSRSLSINNDVRDEIVDESERMWSELLHSDDKRFTEDVVVEMKLKMTLDQFFNHFLDDGAPSSLASQHRIAGDFDVASTNWEKNGDSSSMKRSISYCHPIKTNISMAPSHGQATKNQIMKRFGNYGICIDSEIWTNNVPLADCFYVVDRLLIASNPEGGISLTIKFGNVFIKRTMFKGVINAASVNDITKFHRGFVTSIETAAKKIFHCDVDATNSIQTRSIPDQVQNSSAVCKKQHKKFFFNERFNKTTVLLIVSLLLNMYFAVNLCRMSKDLEKLQMILDANIEYATLLAFK